MRNVGSQVCIMLNTPAAFDGHTAPVTATGLHKAPHAPWRAGARREGRGLDGASDSRAGHLEAIRRISCGRLVCGAQQPAKAPGSHPERQVRLAAKFLQAACLVLWGSMDIKDCPPACSALWTPHESRVDATFVHCSPVSAMRMLEEFVDLEPEDVVIQNGANSAVGRAVIQFAHAQG